MWGSFKVVPGRFRPDIRKHFFTLSAVTHPKRFPREVVNAPSLCLYSKFTGMTAVIEVPLGQEAKSKTASKSLMIH